MPNWLKQTLHIIAAGAAVVAMLPLAGVGIPHSVIAVATAVGVVAAKVTPGIDATPPAKS